MTQKIWPKTPNAIKPLVEGGDLDLFCSHNTVNQPTLNSCRIQKYYKLQYDTISDIAILTGIAWLKLFHATQQQIYNRETEEENNQGAAMTQSKSRQQPDWNSVMRPLAVHK